MYIRISDNFRMANETASERHRTTRKRLFLWFFWEMPISKQCRQRGLHPALHMSAWLLVSTSVSKKVSLWDQAPGRYKGLPGNPMSNISGRTITSWKPTHQSCSFPAPSPSPRTKTRLLHLSSGRTPSPCGSSAAWSPVNRWKWTDDLL